MIVTQMDNYEKKKKTNKKLAPISYHTQKLTPDKLQSKCKRQKL